MRNSITENFYRYLTDGVDVEVRTDSGILGEKMYIVELLKKNTQRRNQETDKNQLG